MKIAIIGSGPLSLLAARHFDELGANTVVFQRSPLGGNLRLLNKYLPDFPIVFKGQTKPANEFFQKDLVELVEYVESRGLTRQGDVLRVHKRFLHPGESIPGKSRLHDLFRVIFSLNPKETILQQLEENPEMFKQLGQEVIESLHRPVESFEDFDIVIEARGWGKKPNAMGASHELALNENNLQTSGLLFYQTDILKKLSLEGKKHLVLVGEEDDSKFSLLHLRNWLKSADDHTLHWITYNKVNFASENTLDKECKKFLTEMSDHFEQAKIRFQTKMHEWRDLEDYVKVKVPMPVEPRAKILFYEGYDVTSVDRLLDREGVFATIETPDFRDVVEAKEDLKTIAADAICVARGLCLRDNLGISLEHDEPGYYLLEAADLDDGLLRIKSIEENLMNYFKKV